MCEKSGSLFYPTEECIDIFIGKAKEEQAHLVIGIDAALAWPVKFAELVASAPGASHQPKFELNGAITNPYLYRETERFVKTKINITALSAPGANFGNNSSKGQALTAWFKKKLGDNVYRPPFDCWDEGTAGNSLYTLIEVYPAASMKSTKFKGLKWPPITQSMESLGDSDIVDAKRAAMTCVCYARTVGMLEGNTYPQVYTPADMSDKAGQIQKEGWIFFPHDGEGNNL